MPVWPAGIPRLCQLQGLTAEPVSNSMVIPSESGEPMTRRRFTGEMLDVSGTITMTRPQAIVLREFWRGDLKDGALRFVDEDPMTLQATEYLFLAPPRFSRIGHRYAVELSLRTMPS